jgi:hypothetical protein
MKKFLLVVVAVLSLLGASPAFAGFDWGRGTYESYDDILIINSLGDQPVVSMFGALGTNDWIPENAVKNYLLMEGYTVANDFNPSITNPQFSSVYNVVVPEGYTKLTFAGKLGDPRQLQDVYVKTVEYERLNSNQQAQRMDGIDTTILDEVTNRISGDTLLQTAIGVEETARKKADNKERKDRIAGDNQLQTNINNEAILREDNDNTLQSNIKNEELARKKEDKKERKARIRGDKLLQNNINNEAVIRSNADTNLENAINLEVTTREVNDDALQTSIDNESIVREKKDTILHNTINMVDSDSKKRDTALQSNLDTETIYRIDGDKRIQDNLDVESDIRYNSDQILQNNINNTNSRIDNVDKRVNSLEQTQGIVEGEVRVYDGRKISVSTFVDYTTTRQTVDRAGIKIVYKLGTSYEERRLDELEARLNMIQPQTTNENIEVVPTTTGFRIKVNN